jgi:transcriptional regulator with GAF, ATPase, and Fis domain
LGTDVVKTAEDSRASSIQKRDARAANQQFRGRQMSSLLISTPEGHSTSMYSQPSPRVDEGALHNRLELLRELTLSLLTELEALGRSAMPAPDARLRLDDEVKRFEISLIRAALDKAHNNQARAARLLGVKHTTLNAKIKRYQLQTRRDLDAPFFTTEQM